MAGSSNTWAYARIITGTILGGVLGFYVMDRVEKSYKVFSLPPLCLSFFLLSSLSVWFSEMKIIASWATQTMESLQKFINITL